MMAFSGKVRGQKVSSVKLPVLDDAWEFKSVQVQIRFV